MRTIDRVIVVLLILSASVSFMLFPFLVENYFHISYFTVLGTSWVIICFYRFIIPAIILLTKGPAPIFGIKKFETIFPSIPSDSPDLFRVDKPHLIDFEHHYVIRSLSSLCPVMSALSIGITEIDCSEITDVISQNSSKFAYCIVAGISGSGKSMMAYRLGFDAKEEGWSVLYMDARDIRNTTFDQDTISNIYQRTGRILLILDNVHLNPELPLHVADVFREADDENLLNPTLRILNILTIPDVARDYGDSSTGYVPSSLSTLLRLSPLVVIEPDITTVERMMTLASEDDLGISSTDLLNISGNDLAVVAEALRGPPDVLADPDFDKQVIANHALERRVFQLDSLEPRMGSVILGIISVFSSIDISVSLEFLLENLECWDESECKNIVRNLNSEGHIDFTHKTPSEKELLLIPHASLANLLFIASQKAVAETIACDETQIIRSLRLDYIKETTPNLSEYLHTLSVVCNFTDDLDMATEIWNRIKNVQLGPAASLAIMNLSRLFWLNNDLVVVEEMVNRAYTLNPRLPQTHTALGLLLEQKGQIEEAMKWYKQAIELDPYHSEAWHNIGVIHLRNGDEDEARIALEGAIKGISSRAPSWSNLAALYLGKEDLVKAEQCAKRAIELDPMYANGWDNLGHVLFKRGDYVEAEKAFKKAIELAPDSREAHYHLGILYSETDRKSKALDEFQAITATWDDFEAGHFARGLVARDLGRMDEALESFRKSVTLNPQNTDAWYNIGSILKQKNLLQDAEREIRSGLSFNPDDIHLLSILGLVLHNQNKISEAEAMFQLIISLDPTNGRAWNNLGWLLEGDDRLSEAEVAYRNAIEHAPDIHQSWYNLAKILTTQGRLDEFQLLIEKASQHDPQLLITFFQLARDLEDEEKTVPPINPEILEEVTKYSIFSPEDLKLLSSNWNEIAELHSRRLFSDEGGELLRKKILNGDFGNCTECGAYLLPFGRRNKPYMDKLFFVCICCDKVRSGAEFVDGSLYGPWFDLDRKTPDWISELKDECA